MKLIGLTVMTALLTMIGIAQATLTVIGTAQFNGTGTEYNLIWEDDNNGNSVVWLDYCNTPAIWQNQTAWAVGLNNELVITLNPGYSVTWTDSSWRLPSTVDDGMFVYGCDGTTTAGYNITTSEMGHLFYAELGNLGCKDTSCNPSSGCQTGYGLQSIVPFQNLIAAWWYWSGTYATNMSGACYFSFNQGSQGYVDINDDGCGLALRSGQVVYSSIPTLSEWSQIMLVVMLGICAFYINRKRQLT